MWKRFQHVPSTRYGRAYVTERSLICLKMNLMYKRKMNLKRKALTNVE